MLKVDSSFDARRSRTSLASIFEDLVSLRKSFLHRQSSTLSQRSWVEKTFFKRECSRFIKSNRDSSRCCCGRSQEWHGILPNPGDAPPEKWHPLKFTEHKPTDAYGTIEFQGAPHPSKAQYVRMSSYDTRPEHVLHLLQKHWGLDLPKLLITVHGGILNFDIQPKLKRVFRKGLLKAARTTGAWIITGGTNTGVTKHVGDAISDRTSKTKNKVVAIGISPWGVVENKESLVGRDTTVPYHCVSSPKTNTAVLNSNHSYFLLLDNGTVGKYGGEIIFRKKFEKFIAQQKICIRSGVKGHGVPVICVVLEGGANTIRSVLEYVTDTPPVPVVVCDGSGRAADLLAFTHKYTLDDGTMPESLRDQLILTIQKTFQYTQEQAEKLFIELMLCVKKKELITVFRMSEGSQDIDLAILTALLKGTNASASDQLNLALTWDRVDIARSHIFVYGQEWPERCLEQAMMDALIHDRVDFVRLLLENGVSMQTFLTIARLEELYNTHHGPSNTLRYLVRDVKKHVPSNYRYTLPDVGLVIQLLMGGAFRSSYCRRRFRQKYNAIKQNGVSLGNVVTAIPQLVNCKQAEELFPYPFHDLMIWAILMKRQKMALFMWQHGEEALAKSLMACKLYKAMAHEADQDDLEIELSQEFHSYAKEFQVHALELLEHCYKIDDDYTQQLLTYELKNFSEQTSLGLAVLASHLDFIAHTCCQLTLNDLWIGGLRTRKNLSFKVILGILMPPFIAILDFKSKEELQLMPQTMEEHLEELEDDASDFDPHSGNSSFDEDQVIENDFGDDAETSFHSGSPGGVKENGNVTTADTSTFSHMAYRKKKSPLRFSKKIYEFYNAPITKFWTHTMAYLLFILCFIYTVLDRPKPVIQWPEYLVMSYILTCALEKIRLIISSEPVSVSTKIRVFLGQAWNIWDMFGIGLFATGMGLRLNPSTLAAANLVYVTDLIFWNIRVLEILSVNKYLGPYVKIICKLLIDMMYFLLIVFLVVTSYGIVRQVVHFQNRPNTPWSYTLRNVWFYPYWMIYGELFADEIDPCYPDSPDYAETCVYGSWLSPFIMTLYLLVANILMVNLLIARFNATFIRNNAMSTQIWKFQRYQLIIGYENRTILPPPLTIISHLCMVFKFLRRRCCRNYKRDFYDNGLKLFLSHEDTEKLHDFEEECMEDYFREKEIRFQNSSEERIRVIYDRVENMSMRVDDMNQKENTIKLSLQSMDYRLNRLEELSTSIAESNLLMRSIMLQNVPQNLLQSQTFNSQESLPDMEEGSVPTSNQHPSTSHAETQSSRSRNTLPSETVIRMQASPILVHSKQPINAQELEKYTSRNRQPSSGSVSLREFQSISGDSDTFVGESSGNTNDNVTAVSTSGLSLMHRRHGPSLRSINVSKARNQTEKALRGSISPKITVTSPDVRRQTQSLSQVEAAPVLSPAHIASDTLLVNPNAKPVHLSLGALRQLNQNTNKKSLTPISPEVTPLSPSKSLPQSSSTFVTSDMASIPSSAVRDLSSILTPLQTEYTSITDDIDTSCMQDRSPQRSPTSAGVFFSESFPDPSEKLRETAATSVEVESLKMAEEVERRRIDKLIRPRLRQISLDDTDVKMSEIAKLVAEATEKDEDSPAGEDGDEDGDSDEADMDSDPVYDGGIEITISAALSDSSGEDSKPVC